MTDADILATREELWRLKAYVICLADAAEYLAIAQRTRDFLPENSLMKFEGGYVSIEYAIHRGLIAAALVSISQIFNTGYAGSGIAGNKAHAANNDLDRLENIIKQMLAYSDQKNGWSNGHTGIIMQDRVLFLRDKFLAHYDESVAGIGVSKDDPTLISWKPPNPQLDPSAFDDVLAAVLEMRRFLQAVIRMAQRDNDERELQE